MSYQEEPVEILSDYEIERNKPMPSKHHAITESNLNFELRLKYGDRFRVLTEISLALPGRERVPDLAIYPSMEFGEEEIRMTEIPLCAIEILSPTQNHLDLNHKRKEYFAAGVQSYWLVFPDLKSVYVYYSPEDFEIYTYRDVLSDKKLAIELDLKEVFK